MSTEMLRERSGFQPKSPETFSNTRSKFRPTSSPRPLTTGEPEYFKADLPEGQSGDWRIEKFVVGEPGPGDGRPDWFRVRPDTYTRLRQGQTVFMTDLYDEW